MEKKVITKKTQNIKHQTFYSTAGLLCSTINAMGKKKGSLF